MNVHLNNLLLNFFFPYHGYLGQIQHWRDPSIYPTQLDFPLSLDIFWVEYWEENIWKQTKQSCLSKSRIAWLDAGIFGKSHVNTAH